MNYLKRYCGQTLEVIEDVADRNQDRLMVYRKTPEEGLCKLAGGCPG